MAEGSRPISRPYEGQRVNPIPEGFLAAYANVGKTYSDAGETLGKGMVQAVSAYVESKKKAGTLGATFNSLAPRFKIAIDRIDKKLGEASPDISAGALDETNVNEDVTVHRALMRAREDLVTGVGKFEDMSNSKKEQWLGSAVNLIKFAEDEVETEKKDAASLAAGNTARITAETARDREARLLSESNDKKTRADLPAGLSAAFANAVAVGKQTAEVRVAESNARKRTVSLLMAAKAQAKGPEEASQIQSKIDSFIQFEDTVTKEAQRTAKFVMEQEAANTVNSKETALGYLETLKTQRAMLLGGAPELLKKFEAGEQFTLDAKTLDALPAPVRKELEYLQADITSLETTINAYGKLKSSDPKKQEAIDKSFTFVPPSASLRADAIVRRQRAQNSYVAQTTALGYTPNDQELEWIADLAEYDGAVTDDGFRITVDPKTGRIEGKKDEQWVALNKKNPLFYSEEERQLAAKRQSELNMIAYNTDRRTFGSKMPSGEQKARRWVYDSFLGVNHVFVRGTAKLDATATDKLHESVNDTQVEMASLSSIIRGISKVDEKGNIVYKKDGDGKDLTVRGVKVPDVKNISELKDPEKKALAIGISNFIRVRAKSLGVLSAQDWAYLDTLIPGISARFATNITAGQSASSLMPKVVDYVITNFTRDSEQIISNAVTLQADARTTLISKFKGIPADGTSTGFLEVTGGIARLEDGSTMMGDSLDRWYDITLTSDYDALNERNDIAEEHARLKILYEMRKSSDETKNAFTSGRDSYKAFLRSRGMDEDQINQILKRYFASEF